MDDDTVEMVSGVEIRVDKMSTPYMRGATIDYLDSLQQSGFTIDNPNAKGSCACGDSAQF
jgi:iron-sulfur cluster assembly accessory protein